MEQKVHELDARLRQMKEERDQVLAENDELQVSIIKSDSMFSGKRDNGMCLSHCKNRQCNFYM